MPVVLAIRGVAMGKRQIAYFLTVLFLTLVLLGQIADAQETYTLTVEVAGGTGDVLPGVGSFIYDAGTTVQISALPEEGSVYAFWSWEGDLPIGGSVAQPVHSLVMDRDRTVTATYTQENTVTLTLSHTGTGTGQTFPHAPGVYRYVPYRSIDLSVEPDAESYFGGWDGALEGFAPVHNIVMHTNKTVTADFSNQGYEVNVEVLGEGATYPAAGTYRLAVNATLDLSSYRTDMSWLFRGWQDESGTTLSTEAQYTVLVDETKTVRAYFEQDTTPPIILSCASPAEIPRDDDCNAFLPDMRDELVATDSQGPVTIEQTPPPGTLITGSTQVLFTVNDYSMGSGPTICYVYVEPSVECGIAEEGEAPAHSADTDADGVIALSELLRIIQYYNSSGFHCDDTGEDGFSPERDETYQDCSPHAGDYNPRDFRINLSELLRIVQFFNSGAYHPTSDEEPETEDAYSPGPSPVN